MRTTLNHFMRLEEEIVAARRVTGLWLDTRFRPIYDYLVHHFSSIILLAFLVVFAVGNIAHAVSANNMALEMALMDGSGMAMEDCQGCPTYGDGDAAATLCQLDCTAPAVVALTSASSFDYMVLAVRQDRPLSVIVPSGLRAPPDPFPPRPLI